MVAAATTLVALLALAARQDAPPPPPPPAPEVETPLLDADGKPVQPGVLPQSTSAPAREAWQALVAAHLQPDGAARPITAFELQLDVRFRLAEGRTNDLAATYRYLAPGYVRTWLGKGSKRKGHLRGPRGDFLIDEPLGQTILLARTRENEQDLRQLDDAVNIARNFAALTQPGSLRLLSVRTVGVPEVLPAESAAAAASLRWLEVESPDFRLRPSEGGGAPRRGTVYRVSLGVDRATGRVAQALIGEASAGERLARTTVFLTLSEYQPYDGYPIPRHLRVWELESAGRKPRFRAEPTSDLWIVSARLAPAFTPADFLP